MKKLVSILLALCLCVGVCPALAEGTTADVSPADTAPANGTFPFLGCSALTRMGDQLLVYADNALFTTRDGETWATYADLSSGPSSVMALAAAQDTVYLLSSDWQGESETYALFKASEGGQPEKIGDLALTSSDGWIQVYGMACVKDALYLLYMGDTRSYGKNTLAKISTADASVTEVGTFPIDEMQPYKDDLLLVCYRDREHSETPSLATLNPETREVKPLAAAKNYTCGAVAWDADTDALYFADTSNLYRLAPGAKEPELCATLIPGYGRQESNAVVVGGKYFLRDDNAEQQLFIASTDPADMPSHTLRLAVNYADDLVRAYTASHKDVAVQVTETAWDAETITQSMVTGSEAADIYAVSLSSGFFPNLRNKGYCVELSSSQKLLDFVSPMYPNLTKEFFRDGKLYGIPVACVPFANLSYHPTVLAELGLTEDDLPKTWLDMMDFIQRWDAEIGPDSDDEFALFENNFDIFSMLFGYMLQDCMLQSEAKGESIRFGTPETIAVLKRLEELRPLLKRMSRNPDENFVFYGDGDSLPWALFGSSLSLSPRNGTSNKGNFREIPLPLTLAEGDPVVYDADITLYIINPNSKNQDLAMEFLEYAAEHMEADTVITLNPNQNDPVLEPSYESVLESHEAYMASAQKSYEEAPEEEKAFWLDMLTMAEEEMEDYMENWRWNISPEAIAAYREIAPHLVASTSELLSGSVTDLSSIFQRFMDGQMSAEQFAREFDRIIMMMEMENQ